MAAYALSTPGTTTSAAIVLNVQDQRNIDLQEIVFLLALPSECWEMMLDVNYLDT